MTSPTLKPSKEFIQHFKKELHRLKERAEEKNQPKPEMVVQAKPQPKAKAKKKPKPKIHAPAPSAIQQIALAPIVARPVPTSTVTTYQSGNYQITERKTFA